MKVAEPTITNQIQGKLKAALIDGKIDIDHPAVILYAKKKKRTRYLKPENVQEIKPAPKKKKKSKPKEYELTSSGENVIAYLDCTLREILNKFGTLTQFKEVLKSVKAIEDIKFCQLKIEKEEETLISRELVSHHVFGAIDGANIRLLTDAPRTIATKVQAHFMAKGNLEEGEEIIRNEIASHLQSVQEEAIKILTKDKK